NPVAIPVGVFRGALSVSPDNAAAAGSASLKRSQNEQVAVRTEKEIKPPFQDGVVDLLLTSHCLLLTILTGIPPLTVFRTSSCFSCICPSSIRSALSIAKFQPGRRSRNTRPSTA